MNLRILLSAPWQDAASPLAWALLDDNGNLRESGNGTLAAMPSGHDVTVILAASRVLATAASLPQIKRSKLETALPFVLEDILTEDVNDMHVTPGAKLPDGRTTLYAMNKNWLLRFMEACTAAKLRLRRIVPEFCLLPTQGSEWSLAWDGVQGFLSLPSRLGGALDRGSDTQAPATLQLRLQQGAPAALRLFALGSEVQAPSWGVQTPVIFERQSFDWRKAEVPADAPNLLWGKFAPAPRISEFWPWLRPALMVLLMLFLVEAVTSNIEWALQAHEKRQLTQRMTEIFQETFGANTTVVDAPLQMKRSVARLRHAVGASDDADFLPLLDKFSGALTGVGGNLRTLRYGDGRLDIDLSLPNAAALNLLLQRLAEAGLRGQVTDKHETGSALNIQLSIATGGAK